MPLFVFPKCLQVRIQLTIDNGPWTIYIMFHVKQSKPRLFPNTKPAEDLIKNLLCGSHSDNFTQGIKALF